MATTKTKQMQAEIESLRRQLGNTSDALEVALALSPERDNNFFGASISGLYGDPLNRSAWDRRKVFGESLRAWRVNPIARRIVKLMTSFILGKGIKIKCENAATQKFLDEWWSHHLNKIGKNAKRWKDEDTRTGNLFAIYTVDQQGMSYVRMIPAEQVAEIETVENDVEQEIAYYKDENKTEKWADAYRPGEEQDKFILHFASNKPVGSCWGEADLTPLLVWIGRFSTWLEDRVRLNHFRTIFLYTVTGNYKDEAERKKRENDIRANPPKEGSVLVLNANAGEVWSIMSAQLDSFDAERDGLAIKKMISAGVGFPLHYLAEPESSTSTTAEAAGTPTFRTLEEAQDDYFETVAELARVAVEVRSRFDKSVNPKAVIEVEGPDITERDNATLALALGRSYPHLADLLDREGITDEEFLRIVYKMFAEVWKGEAPKIKRKPLTKPEDRAPAASPDDEAEPTDPKEEQ